MARSSLVKFFVTLWLVCAFIAHTGRKSAIPDSSIHPQHPSKTKPHNVHAKLTEFKPADSHVTSFHLRGRITTNLNVADLLVVYDIKPFHDQFTRLQYQINNLPKDIFYPRRLSVINKEMDQTKQLIIVHDHLLHKLDRRGIWSSFVVITGLFASWISIAAMAEAHSAKTDINDLKEKSSRIFHAHSLAINDHAIQLSNLTENQALIAEQVRANNGLFYANRVKDHIMEFQDAVKDRNKAISYMITTFSEQLAVAASNLLKNIHDKGYSSIEDLKPMDFTSLPFSVSHHGDSRYILHIHVPIFKNPTTDLMNVYEYMPLPWYLLDKHNNSVIATPVDAMGFNAISIPDHDEKSDLHQIFNIQKILGCHRFKDIYICPSTDIYAASHIETRASRPSISLTNWPRPNNAN